MANYETALRDDKCMKHMQPRAICPCNTTDPKEAVDKIVEGIAKKIEDVVKKPSHYQVIEGVEAIELIARALTVAEFKGYCLGNIMKYRLRAGGKDDLVQEIAKAKFYVDLFELHKSQCRAG